MLLLLFATSGPMLTLQIDHQEMGSTLQRTSDAITPLEVNVRLQSLDNIQTKLLSSRPNPLLLRLYEFNWSGRASAVVLAVELALLVAIALIVFRRQEIVY